jgi:hypothetical protein
MKYLILMFVLISCSSMDRKTCLTTNWYEKGLVDARDRGEDEFESYKRACAEESVSIFSKSQEYKKGFLEGLRSWCTFQNGFNQGLEGHRGTANCEDVNPAFARGYEEGFREYRLIQRRKRDEEEGEKKYSADKEAFRQRVLSQSDTKECTVDSDCHKQGQCRYNRCAHDNKVCTYDYECKVRGRCREVSEYAHNQRITLRVCDY